MLLGAERPTESGRNARACRLIRFMDVLREHDGGRASVADCAEPRYGRFHSIPCELEQIQEQPVGRCVAGLGSNQKPAVPIRCAGIHAVAQRRRVGCRKGVGVGWANKQLDRSNFRLEIRVDDLIPDVLSLEVRQQDGRPADGRTLVRVDGNKRPSWWVDCAGEPDCLRFTARQSLGVSRQFAFGRVVDNRGEGDVLDVVRASSLPRQDSWALDGRKQQGQQHADDRDHDQ
jgi:hypothetical protein